jgi:hypothetical protein
MLSPDVLSNLDRLEAESLHILREVAAEFRNPVMLYFDRQGQHGAAAPAEEGLPSGAARHPAAARRTPPGSSAR